MRMCFAPPLFPPVTSCPSTSVARLPASRLSVQMTSLSYIHTGMSWMRTNLSRPTSQRASFKVCQRHLTSEASGYKGKNQLNKPNPTISHPINIFQQKFMDI